MGQSRPAVSLLAATGGEPARSPLWDRLLWRFGVTDILSTVFADKHGCWGWLDLWRGGAEGGFTDEETAYVASVAPALAAGLRRSRAAQCRRDAPRATASATAAHRQRHVAAVGPEAPAAAGGADIGRVDGRGGQTASAGEWLGLLQPGPRPYQGVPAEVLNVAAQLVAREAGVDSHPALSRVPLGSGDWALLRAARMEGTTALEGGRPGSTPPLAVTIQECPAVDRLEVFARCFALDQAAAQVAGTRRRRAQHGGAGRCHADQPLHRSGPVQSRFSPRAGSAAGAHSWAWPWAPHPGR